MADGRAVVVSRSAGEAAEEVARRLVGPDSEVVTVVVGLGVEEGEAREVAARLRDRFPGVQVDLVWGGQPRYPFLLGVE
jgi:dihydroxyacetone kinase-like predicted kinase